MTLVIAILIAAGVLATAAAVAFPYGRRALLAWYLGEIENIEVAEDPEEAIVTYPLA